MVIFTKLLMLKQDAPVDILLICKAKPSVDCDPNVIPRHESWEFAPVRSRKRDVGSIPFCWDSACASDKIQTHFYNFSLLLVQSEISIYSVCFKVAI